MSTVATIRTRDGVSQLERRWPVIGNAWCEMVLVHGLGEHSGRYERVGQLFADAGIAVTAFDLRGHGRTDGRRAYVESFDAFLDDVEDHIGRARKRDRPVVLLGHSLGGLIATTYAVSGRPAPDRLVLSAPALDAATPRWQRLAAPFLSRKVPKLALSNPIDVSQLSRDPKVGEAYLADPLVTTRSTTRLGAEVFATMETTKRRLMRLEIPTLIVHGGEDTLVRTEFSEAFGTHPDVTRRVYPGLRHEVFNEPEGPEVVREVIDWLEQELERRPV
jgi:alpha-beta hydrolase superfamily lysophospholipase